MECVRGYKVEPMVKKLNPMATTFWQGLLIQCWIATRFSTSKTLHCLRKRSLLVSSEVLKLISPRLPLGLNWRWFTIHAGSSLRAEHFYIQCTVKLYKFPMSGWVVVRHVTGPGWNNISASVWLCGFEPDGCQQLLITKSSTSLIYNRCYSFLHRFTPIMR